ncbi:MAG: DUF2971 domain-containing protein [Betaproteobacteria bacterium]|nr:DUF2971 domain-containing protein [Betaproteobacteria bacterium]
MEIVLRRYTELPYVVDLLQTKEMVLVSPAAWDDRNDSYYIEQYARREEMASTYALCLAEASETYHHWKVFSHGCGGACIVFKRDKLMQYVRKVDGLRAEPVQYRTIKDLRAARPTVSELPFLKRAVFADEKEFRLFLATKTKGQATHRFPIAIAVVEKITLSPWLPKEVVAAVRTTLQSIEGCRNLLVGRSTLVENEVWKQFGANGP